jgi:hypothetical protein
MKRLAPGGWPSTRPLIGRATKAVPRAGLGAAAPWAPGGAPAASVDAAAQAAAAAATIEIARLLLALCTRARTLPA